MRETRGQLGDRFELSGTHVQVLEPLLVRDVGENRRRTPGIVRQIAAQIRDGYPELQFAIVHLNDGLGSRRARPCSNRPLQRPEQRRRRTVEFGAHGPADVRHQLEPEQRAGCLIDVLQHARRSRA